MGFMKMYHVQKMFVGGILGLSEHVTGRKFEDQNALQKTVVQYFTSLGKEQYCEGMFKLVK
jgi:hypothetical protein